MLAIRITILCLLAVPDSLRHRLVGEKIHSSWAMRGFTDLSIRGLGWQAVLPSAGVLLGFAAIFFAIGLMRLHLDTR